MLLSIGLAAEGALDSPHLEHEVYHDKRGKSVDNEADVVGREVHVAIEVFAHSVPVNGEHNERPINEPPDEHRVIDDQVHVQGVPQVLEADLPQHEEEEQGIDD